MSVASVRGLTVKYGRKVVIDNCSVDVPEGCVGLLGPNGAGKTTLIRTLLGFLTPAQGECTLLGRDVRSSRASIRSLIGFMPEQDCHIPGINAVSFVAYAGELCGMPSAEAHRRAHEVLEYCGLGEARYRNVETYSTGMKQRIKLAQALVHGPQLLFLDEPTNGLDPEGRDRMLELVKDISHGKGVNVIVSSHVLPDIERTCDQVVVLQSGRVVAAGEISKLKATDRPELDVELREASDGFIRSLAKRDIKVVKQVANEVRLQFPPNVPVSGRIVFEAAQEAQAQVRAFRPAIRSLEDVFMEAVR